MVVEKRFVDANAVRNALYDADSITMKGVAIINQFPTVDAVEVVRCKDCKSYNGGGCDLVYGEYEPDPNDFCSRGTKKYEIDVELMDDGE